MQAASNLTVQDDRLYDASPVQSFLEEARVVTRDTRSQLAREGNSRSRENYERLLWAAIARCHGDALICTDLDGIVTSWNENAARIFGYSDDEMIGTNFSRIV